MNRRIYILGYINEQQFEKRKPIQARVASFWLMMGYDVHVLDSVFTETEFYDFMPKDVVRHSNAKFKHICFARNFAIDHATSEGVDDFIAIADNDCTLRFMDDFDLDVIDLLDAMHTSDADVIFASPPADFHSNFFKDNKKARTHLLLHNQNNFKGSLLWVHTKTDHRFDTWFDEARYGFAITPTEDNDFGLRGKRLGYKIRIAKQLKMHEHGGIKSSTWCPDTSIRTQYKPADERNDRECKKTWNKKYNQKYKTPDYIEIKDLTYL